MGSKSAVKGCLIAVAIVVLLLGIVAAVGVGIGFAKVRQLREDYTDTTPLNMEVAHTTDQEARALQRKAEAIRRAVENGTGESFTLSEREINQMIASLPAAKELRGRVSVDLDGDTVKATASIPLDQFPGMQGRYLNGDITLSVACQNGRLQIYAEQVSVRGKPVPESIMKQLRAENLAKDVNSDPDVTAKLRNVEFIRVEDSRLVVQTKQTQ